MEFILRQIHNAGSFSWLYLLSLFLGFHFFSVQFIHSSFLATFLSKTGVSILYTIAYALALVVLTIVGLLLARFGNYHTTLIATALDFVAVLCLAGSTNVTILMVSFMAHTILVPVILFTLDVFFGNNNQDKENTGNARGIFLSVATGAALLSPVLAGILIGETTRYERVYLASALFLLPFVGILIIHFRSFVDPLYNTFSPWSTLRTVFRNTDLRRIITAQFLMRFYFAWMTIYLPLYLHEEIGFSWLQIGTILFVMLVPYVFVEWPAGIIADKLLGEKELLIAGLLLTAIPTGALLFLTTPNLILWGAILFITRIGTALIESMTEIYFFKKIDGDDTDMITFFRILRPLAYTIAPLTATLILLVTNIRHLWLALACIMLAGVYPILRLTDTK